LKPLLAFRELIGPAAGQQGSQYTMQNFVSNLLPGKAAEDNAASGGGAHPDVPWYMKYAAKVGGVAAGIGKDECGEYEVNNNALFSVVAILFGFMCILSFSVTCIIAGIFQVLAGFLVIVVEAPFCCMFLGEPQSDWTRMCDEPLLDFVQQISAAAEGRPVWQKAAFYLALSLPVLFLCRQISTLVGSGAIFAMAVVYGLQVMGKK